MKKKKHEEINRFPRRCTDKSVGAGIQTQGPWLQGHTLGYSAVLNQKGRA